jgi:hypothetical protein
LLCGSPYTSVTYDADGEASRKAGKTNGKTRAKLDKAGVERHVLRDW